MVRELVEEKNSEGDRKPIEIGDLSKLIDRIQEYQVLTEQKFRKYTEGVARSRKMHEAYK